MLNIWKQFPKGGYYLNHPVRFVCHLFRPFKWAWQRCTRGYADCDWWDAGQFLIELIPSILKKMAEDPSGYPCNMFHSTAEWQEYLRSIALRFMNANEDMCPEENEYESMFTYAGVTETKHSDGTISIVSNATEELRKNYWNRTVEINQYRERELGKAFELLHPVFFTLWD